MNFIGPCNHTGIGHHAIGLACALSTARETNYHPIYQDYNLKAKILELANLHPGPMDPEAPTFIFDSPWPTTWYNSGRKRILLLPFETTSPIPYPERIFHNIDYVGSFGSWGVEILKEYLPEERLFQVPYAAALKGVGLFSPIIQRIPDVQILEKLAPPKGITFSLIAKAELRKCLDLVLSQMPYLGRKHTIYWFGTDAGVGLKGQQIHDKVRNMGYHIENPHQESAWHFVMTKGDTQIYLMKFLHMQDLWAFAGATDYFLAFSRGEGWGIPPYEALAQGMRVIGSEVGNQAEFLNDRTAFAVKPDGMITAVDTWTQMVYPGKNPKYYNHIDIIEPITTALKLTDEEWQKKTSTARELTLRYSWEDVGKRLAEIGESEGGLDDRFRSSWYLPDMAEED